MISKPTTQTPVAAWMISSGVNLNLSLPRVEKPCSIAAAIAAFAGHYSVQGYRITDRKNYREGECEPSKSWP
jgi:hypothetical protein